MIPKLNNRNANSPAIGFNASAACAEVWMSLIPCPCNVTAAVNMMKNAIRFETPIPIIVSILIRRSCFLACSGLSFSGRSARTA